MFSHFWSPSFASTGEEWKHNLANKIKIIKDSFKIKMGTGSEVLSDDLKFDHIQVANIERLKLGWDFLVATIQDIHICISPMLPLLYHGFKDVGFRSVEFFGLQKGCTFLRQESLKQQSRNRMGTVA